MEEGRCMYTYKGKAKGRRRGDLQMEMEGKGGGKKGKKDGWRSLIFHSIGLKRHFELQLQLLPGHETDGWRIRLGPPPLSFKAISLCGRNGSEKTFFAIIAPPPTDPFSFENIPSFLPRESSLAGGGWRSLTLHTAVAPSILNSPVPIPVPIPVPMPILLKRLLGLRLT